MPTGPGREVTLGGCVDVAVEDQVGSCGAVILSFLML